MATIKTNNNRPSDNIEKALKAIEKWVNQQQKASKANAKEKDLEARLKKAEKEAKDRLDFEKSYAKKVKELEDQVKEDKYKDRMNLAKNSVDAVMPAERRASFGAAGVGALMGIDPAIVQMLGIDKLGANLWNSKFGFGAIQKRHDQKVKEEKLNEEFGINAGKSKEKYGSVVKDDPTKELKEINKNTKEVAKNTAGEKGGLDKGKKGESGGLLSKILGFGQKLLIPLLVGMLVNAFRSHIKNGIADLLGGGELGQFLGGAIADFLPGAVAGLAAAKKFGLPWWKGALLGGTITYVWPRLMQTFGDIKRILSGEGNPDAGNTNRYLEKMLGGALLGASIAKWGPGSFKAAAIGALIGGSVEFVLSSAEKLREIFNGKPVPIKMIGGVIPEEVFGTAIAGATIGMRHGWKAAGMGALLGAGVGLLTAMINDSRNQMLELKAGNMKPESAFGSWGKIVAPMIAGAAIGAKYGIKGALIGGLIGGAIGGLMMLVDKMSAEFAQTAKNSQEAREEYVRDTTTSNAATTGEWTNAREKELKEKLKTEGALSEDEKDELEKLEAANYRGGKRMADAKKADLNHDGIITADEYKNWHDNIYDDWTGMGGQSRSDTQMKALLKQSGGKGFKISDLADYAAEQYDSDFKDVAMKSTPMPTASQIQDDKNTKAQDKNTQALDRLADIIEKKDMQTKVIENNSSPAEPLTAYSTGGITGASLGGVNMNY